MLRRTKSKTIEHRRHASENPTAAAPTNAEPFRNRIEKFKIFEQAIAIFKTVAQLFMQRE